MLQSAQTPAAGWWNRQTCDQCDSRPNSRFFPPEKLQKSSHLTMHPAQSCIIFTNHHIRHNRFQHENHLTSLNLKYHKRLLFKFLGILAIVLIEVRANLCCESESWWHGQANAGHLCQICTFSTKKILHLSSAISLSEFQKQKHQKQNTSKYEQFLNRQIENVAFSNFNTGLD